MRKKRPFTGLRKRGPQESYDVIIIGAGIGGLICANLLQRDGLKVLMVEQHYMMGGYCSTFRRKGYTFDAATHFYPLLGNTTTMTGKLLQDLGIETKWVKMDPIDSFHFPDNSSFHVPGSFHDYRAKLDEMFPHEVENLKTFFQTVRETYLLGLLHYFRGRETERLKLYRDWTVKEVLDRTFRDPKLKLLLTADCPHWGSAPRRTSFVFDSMLRLSYFLGNYYPVEGSQAFADALASRFEELGGDIMINTMANKILVRDGRAYGVEIDTKKGALKGVRQIKARTVISNADLLQTVERLLEPKDIDPAYVGATRRLRPTYPCYLCHIGLKGLSHEQIDAVQGYYWSTWNTDLVARHGVRCKIFSPTVYEPRMAPEGGQIIIIQKLVEVDFDAITDWPAHKQEVEDYMIAHLDRVLPGVEDNIVVKTTASAMTSYRFTLNYVGAMLGWEMTPDQLGADRPGLVGPVDDLYLVGHWTQPGGGITPVIVSAVEVAKLVSGRASGRQVSSGILEHWRATERPGSGENKEQMEQMLSSLT